MTQFVDSTGKGYWSKESKAEGDKELGRGKMWDNVAGQNAGGGKTKETGAEPAKEVKPAVVRRSKRKG